MKRGRTRQSEYLNAMGLTRWVLRVQPQETRKSGGEVSGEIRQAMPPREPQAADSASPLDQDELKLRVINCDACKLSEYRNRTVFGAGDPHADWLIIGEAPGEQEDLQGEPFVGRAGLLLNNMLNAIGLSRERVYIANIVKCRPPGNRDPLPEEIQACSGYLQRQVELIRPRLILLAGRIAAQSLLNTDTAVGRLRGCVYRYPGLNIPMIVTWHPAYLLRRPSEKRKSWDDLKLALSTLRDDHGA